MGVTAEIRGSGDKIDNDVLSSVFVQGGYNQGKVIEHKEIETTAFHPGETVDWKTGAGGEDNVTIGGNASVHLAGIAEIDFGQISSCSTAYGLADDAPIIFFHWNPGSLLRNIQMVNPAAALEPGTLLGTTSGTAGSLKDDTTTGICMKSYKYVADPAAAFICVAWIYGYY